MSDTLQARLNQLEMLYSEQDHTIQALNDMVARQNLEIFRLNTSIEHLKTEMLMLKTDSSADMGSNYEKPPHY